MTRLFRSKSCGLPGTTEFNRAQQRPLFPTSANDCFDVVEYDEEEEEEEEEEEGEEEAEEENDSMGKKGGGGGVGRKWERQQQQMPILDILVGVLRKSLVTCSVERDDLSSTDISWPTDVRHVSHVTFDRFNGFLGLPNELQPHLPPKVPSASASVFGVSAKSMQCSYDERGNSIPTILLMMQRRLYAEGGLKAEGIFRINAENSQEEYVREQLNKGAVPYGIDVHCLAGLIKAWLRELPTGVLDSLTPEQVMHCNTEEECSQLVKLLPPTEAALLDWAINLMADVVQHEAHNKMNARNIAMVFAPNMTQMADPLTALIHAVQVMNFLKTLILKTLREWEETVGEVRLPLLSLNCPTNEIIEHPATISDRHRSHYQTPGARLVEGPVAMEHLNGGALDELETTTKKGPAGCQTRSVEEEEEVESSSSSSLARSEAGDGDYGSGDWLRLRKGVRKLCRRPVFQMSKPAKKTRSYGTVNSRGGGEGETWA
ncbi:rho GTPase-activating protein 3 [Rhodamnia argentea]|uniref:Rho GTPase-activating protein 3 n=1 Tax=Rhodamnia argentea TaxID=178133 RepID=A0A8B8QP34_9MYRT|nr:rho GTPase-activating protein 3 [Rhodamnia argentea]